MAHEQLYACTLSPEELREAAASYARAAERYDGTVAFDGARARVWLRGDKRHLAALLDEMIAREGSCCSHLRIAPSETVDGYRVDLHVTGALEMAGEILRATLPVLFPTARDVTR